MGAGHFRLLVVQAIGERALQRGHRSGSLIRLVERLLDQALERRHLLILRGLQLFDLILKLRHVALDGKNVLALLREQAGRRQASRVNQQPSGSQSGKLHAGTPS